MSQTGINQDSYIECYRIFFVGDSALQFSQEEVLSPVWILMCLLSFPFWENLTPQISQWKGFSWVWVLVWSFRLQFSENLAPQISQAKGFSPVWVLIWRLRFPFWENLAPQISQGKGFSSVCLCKWLSRLDIVEKLARKFQQEKVSNQSESICGFEDVFFRKIQVYRSYWQEVSHLYVHSCFVFRFPLQGKLDSQNLTVKMFFLDVWSCKLFWICNQG